MVSKVLALLAQTQGFEVKQSEVHGMAKRGGSVFSHVRFGQRVWSPTIPKGEADILVALEWAEGLRWLPLPQARHRHLHLRHQAHRAALRLPQPASGRADALFARDAGRSRRACRRRLRHRRHRHGRGTRQRARGQRRPARRAVDGARISARGLGAARSPSSCRRRPSRSISRRSGAAAPGSRRRATLRRPPKARRSTGAGRARAYSVRLEITSGLVQELRHLREAVPGALPAAERRAHRRAGRAGQMHRLPAVRMAVPGFRHPRASRCGAAQAERAR